MFSPVTADLTAEKPVMAPLDMSAETPLPERYQQLVWTIQHWLLQIWPGAAYRYPETILLPTDLAEYLEITHSPSRDGPYQYATSFPSVPATAFAPRHQVDMANFIGAMNADNLHEVDAVKCIVHELIHMANPSPYKGAPERLVCECATELCALVGVIQHVPFIGDRDTLIKALGETAYYRDSLQQWADIVVSISGSAQNAIELCKVLVYNPPDWSLDLVSNLVAEKFMVRVPDVLDLLNITPDRYDDNLRQLVGELDQAAMKISGDGSSDTLFWIANNSRLL